MALMHSQTLLVANQIGDAIGLFLSAADFFSIFSLLLDASHPGLAIWKWVLGFDTFDLLVYFFNFLLVAGILTVFGIEGCFMIPGTSRMQW